MKRNLYLLLICCGFIFNCITINNANAAPAYPYPVEVTQPDGTKLTVQLRGDEFLSWAETIDGYTLLYNEKGIYEYAISDGKGGMIPSGFAAKASRAAKEKRFLDKTQKNLRFSSSQLSMMKSISNMQETQAAQADAMGAFPTTGNRKLICILMGFTDRSFTKSQADFNALFNQVNYTVGSATGSVKDFYTESSYGQLNLEVTVVGPYKAANNMAYYGANNESSKSIRARELVTEAINAADPHVNYSDFDNDKDGAVDGVYMIYAGYGEEAGGGADAIWAHAWSINTVYKDGVSLSRYSCSAELRGNSGSTITGIGVICHEFGHVLGAMDYYDTDYTTGGQFTGTGRWDMMAGGSWNNNGDTPAEHNAFTKCYVYKWATPTTLSSSQNVTVNNSVQNKSFYRINSTTSGEYWLMENRQNIGFDAKLPGHGLLIYHVHSGVGNVGNKINATYPQRMYPVCASATSNPGSSSDSYGSINSSGCPFPGSSGKTSFTDATTPNMKSWAGANSNAPITNINESNGVITFTFKDGGGSSCSAPSPSVTSTTTNSIALSWSTTGANSYYIYAKADGGSWYKAAENLTTTSYTVTGLTANTNYTFDVYSSCPDGSTPKGTTTGKTDNETNNELATMTSPSNGATLSGSSQTFSWTSTTGSYWLYVGTYAGDKSLYSQSQSGTSVTVSGLPTNGSKLYVRLWTNNGNWVYNDYTYTAAGGGSSCSAPSPSVTSTTTSSINLSWSATGASSYYIYAKADGGSWYQAADNLTSTSYTVTGLTANTNYTFDVYSRCSDGSTPKGSTTGKTDAETNNSVSEITSPTNGATLAGSSQTFKWTSTTGSYWLYVGTSQGGSNLYGQSQSGTSVTVSGLPTDGSTVYVRLWTNTGTWQYKDYTYKAYKPSTSCAAPDVSVASKTTSSVKLQWNSAGANSYYIYARPQGGSWWYVGNVGTATSKDVTGLSANTTYDFDVYSVCPNGTYPVTRISATTNSGSSSGISEITSPAPGSDASGTQTFKWTSTTGTYWIYIGSFKGGSDYLSKSTNYTSMTITGLPSSKYYLRLWTYSGDWKYNDYVYNGVASENPMMAVGSSSNQEPSGDLNNLENMELNAYPNPFSDHVDIAYNISQDQSVSLEIYSVSGAKVAVLVAGEEKAAGNHSIGWDASNVAAGIYVGKLTTKNGIQTIKLQVVK